jgi:deazaflavin-dependent oxidoreductase (nitroreductase family)
MRIFGLFNRLSVWLHRFTGGRATSSMMGFPVVLLTTRGARTGLARTTPLGGFPDGDHTWLVVASLGGATRHPAWFHNMATHPDDIWLEVESDRFKVHGETLHGTERSEALARIGAIQPRYLDYQDKTDREIPIVRLTRVP